MAADAEAAAAVCDFGAFIDDMCLRALDASLPPEAAFVVEALLLLVAFCGLAAAADAVCNALETLCDRWSIPEDVGGATFLAIGGALPETTVNTITTIRSVSNARLSRDHHHVHGGNSTALGVGAIIGSGVIAFLLIPSVCYVVSPGPMRLKRRPLVRDVFFYVAMVSVLLTTMGSGVTAEVCGSFVLLYVAYLCVLLFGREVRLRVMKLLGRDLVQPRTSIFRDRYSQSDPDSPRSMPNLEDYLLADDPWEEADVPAWKRVGARLFELVTKPVDATCIDCRIDQPHEAWYPLTCVAGLVWTTFYSWMVTCLIDNWVSVLHEADSAKGFFGFALVALGAEIPDTINAATAASRGYGSMAISSCFGAQVVNVGLGLGLPWSAATFLGQEVPLVWPHSLACAAYSQRINACLVLVLLMCTSVKTIDRKANVTLVLVCIFLALYASAVGWYGVWTFDSKLASSMVTVAKSHTPAMAEGWW
jgi:Ca2+/Na+ antiporter